MDKNKINKIKVYIGRDKDEMFDRICISTRKIKYLTKSKYISQPYHNYSRWTFIDTNDFIEVKKLYKKDMKGIRTPRVGEVYQIEMNKDIFSIFVHYGYKKELNLGI